MYCPNTICFGGKVMDQYEKNINRTKISSMLVAAKPAMPIAIRPEISAIVYKCDRLSTL
jgi:hypothetical protein